MSEKKLSMPVIAVAGVLVIIGAIAYAMQLMNGLGVTGMNNATSWGTYIACFMFFVGLSAGGLIVASSASVFGIKQFKAVSKPAIVLSLVCICAAGMFVLIDLGSLQRIFGMLVHPNPTSPLFWDMCIITIYIVINVVYLVLMRDTEKNAHAITICSRFALPVAILVHSVTAWIFGLQISREWYSAIMAPLFVASALDSGLALLLIVLAIQDKRGSFKVEPQLFAMLAGLLATFVAVDGYMVGCEVLTMAYPGGDSLSYLTLLATGSTAPFFWFEIICGIVIPFCILVFKKNRQNRALVCVASVLIVLGVFCKRVWLLFTAFATTNVSGGLGITLGNSSYTAGTDIWTMAGIYSPTMIEVGIVIGMLGLCVLAYEVLFTKLVK